MTTTPMDRKMDEAAKVLADPTAYADDFADHTARTLHWVETDDGRIPVQPAPGAELPGSGHFEGTVAVPSGRTLAGAAADAPRTVVSAEVSPSATTSTAPTTGSTAMARRSCSSAGLCPARAVSSASPRG